MYGSNCGCQELSYTGIIQGATLIDRESLMNHLSLKMTVYALTTGLCVFSPEIATGQTLADETAWEVPRMADGRPDLQLSLIHI